MQTFGSSTINLKYKLYVTCRIISQLKSHTYISSKCKDKLTKCTLLPNSIPSCNIINNNNINKIIGKPTFKRLLLAHKICAQTITSTALREDSSQTNIILQ